MKNCGFSEEEAKRIEKNYHDLYKVADEYTADIIKEAQKIGYIPLAFGGRIRTPLLAKTIGKGRKVPYAAQAEGRSAGNAHTQSYCVLTIRALNEFLQRVWESEYRYDILPSATIHDAIYLLNRNSVKIVKWINDNLIDCMSWQELDELKHPDIAISSSVEIFWPSWSNAIEIKNNADISTIKTTCATKAKKYIEEKRLKEVLTAA